MAGVQPKKTAIVTTADAIRTLGVDIPPEMDLSFVWRSSPDPLALFALAVACKSYPQIRRRAGLLLHTAVLDLHSMVPSRVENAVAAVKSAHATTGKLLESVSVVEWMPSVAEMQEAAVDWYETDAWATASILSMYCGILVASFLKLENGARLRIPGELISLFAARAVVYRIYLGEGRAAQQNKKLCDGIRALIPSPEFV